MRKKSSATSFDGFSKLKRSRRIAHLTKMGLLTHKEAARFQSTKTLPFSLAEKLIENLIGYYHLPLGVAVNFVIDAKEFVIPMVIEETSVVAAASKTARWVKENGSITTKTLGNNAIGQIQIAKVKNFDLLKDFIEKNKAHFIRDANEEIASSMVRRGGGVREIELRHLPRSDGGSMAVIHVMIDTCDAMGANIINQICEYLRVPIEKQTNETVTMCILSNLSDQKLTRANIVIDNIDYAEGKAIEEASLFAQLDPYRAATNNKGALNGMDAVALATGNDWRAVEAGVHSYAAHTGRYSPITHWKMQDKKLLGELLAPISVGIYGGVTRVHPTADLCLKMLGVKKAEELSRVIAAVGLVQNLGALRALTMEGICKGHMRLHITNLCLAAGAKHSEIEKLKKDLEKLYVAQRYITVSDIVKKLKVMRK